ncbi:phosphate uptake regulator [Methanohalophilus levihalophilus]|uniref:phosphate uptake regulator PhoU n=1 Tax=Methanohalophilus levihalophilus TaxID=1431282 RepID=UPI001AE3E101|nr:phosphate uptake regulator PhoU [Methanohalophilus levihalophilus]MBP2029440.1 phosphate uptake regulator [Methanohalophilus levihalophilus]
MDMRKIQITGKSTYVMTLPKKWACQSNLKAGSQVALNLQDDGSLVIIPEKSLDKPSKITLEIKDDIEEMKRELIGVYLMARHDFIELKGPSISKELKVGVATICEQLIGLEVVDSNGDSVLIQDLLDSDSFTIERGLQRLYAITITMIDDLVRAIENNDHELFDYIISRDSDADRLFMLISKQFINRLNLKKASTFDSLDLINAFYYRLAAENIERIADHATRIAENMKIFSCHENNSKKLQTLLRNAQELFRESYDSLRYSDKELANSVLSGKDPLSDNFENDSICANSGCICMAIPVSSILRIRDYATNIAEFTIDLSQL